MPGNPVRRDAACAGGKDGNFDRSPRAVDDVRLDTLLRRADAALYAAKRAGRNRCIVDGLPEGAEAQDTLL